MKNKITRSQIIVELQDSIARSKDDDFPESYLMIELLRIAELIKNRSK
jgi:hypothetical protein